MLDPIALEAAYQNYVHDLKNHLPDGVVEVNVDLLQELGILEVAESEEEDLNHNFYVVESTEKLTLFNQKFAIWIVPQLVEQNPVTFTLIALNAQEKPHLEMAFSTAGVYNHSSLVLRVLEKFLDQIEENEKEIIGWDKTN